MECSLPLVWDVTRPRVEELSLAWKWPKPEGKTLATPPKMSEPLSPEVHASTAGKRPAIAIKELFSQLNDNRA